MSRGNHTQAWLLAQRALSIAEKDQGSGAPLTTWTISPLQELASLYLRMGDYAQARLLAQRALAIAEEALRSNTLDTGPFDGIAASSIFVTLARLYEQMGDYAQARLLIQRALAIWEEMWGSNSPATAFLLNHLAELYTNMEDYPQALQFFRRGLANEDRSFASMFAITSEEQKLWFTRKSQRAYFAALSLLYRQFPTDAAAVRFGLELVLRRKGLVLDTQARHPANAGSQSPGRDPAGVAAFDPAPQSSCAAVPQRPRGAESCDLQTSDR